MNGHRAGVLAFALAAIASGCGSRIGDPNPSSPTDAASVDEASVGDAGSDEGAPACPNGTASCSGRCVDTKRDPAHCGACDRACADGEVCDEGACRLACPPELVACSGSCRDLRWDPGHCGACDTACEPGLVCSGGVCTLSCAAGAVRCGAACVDVAHDPANCGSCGVACAKGASCAEGTCACPSATPDVCDGKCVDTKSDGAHCGACGNTCANARCATATIPGGAGVGSPLVTSTECVKALEVAVSPSHACARVKIGTIDDVWCWGDNAKSELGREFIASDPVPAPVQRRDGPWALGTTNALAVGPGSTHVRIGTSDWMWGTVGLDYPVKRAEPWAPAKDIGIGSIGVGAEHVCWTPAPHGEVRCVGRDTSGALGQGSPATGAPFVKAPNDWPTASVLRARKVSASGWTTCALGDDGSEIRKVYCWGKLLTSYSFASIPEKVSDREATDVVVGGNHACMRARTTGVWACWGTNDAGQCGLDPTVYGTKVVVPIDIPWTSPSLAAGEGFNCGLNAGKVFCWGTNANGELGDGTEVARSATPREVLGITGAVSVSATDRAACAVKDDGTVWCWGRQQKGRFGKVADGIHRKPVRVEF